MSYKHNIQTMAYKQSQSKVTPPSNEKVQNLLERLYNSTDDIQLQNELIGAYRKYISKGRNAKKPNEWVNLAVSSDKTRHYLNGIYCNNDSMVATDGYRMHIAPKIDVMEHGKYYFKDGVINEELSVTGRFPDYEKLIHKNNKVIQLDLINPDRITTSGKVTIMHYDIYDEDDTYIETLSLNKKHTDEMLALGGDYKLLFRDAQSHLIFDFDDGRIGVLMPMKVEQLAVK